jgi:hypothetical protein
MVIRLRQRASKTVKDEWPCTIKAVKRMERVPTHSGIA